ATWQPVIDGVVMPQAPIDALRSGSFNQVPTIEGTNHDEMTIFAPTLLDTLDLSTPTGLGTYLFILGTITGNAAVPAINAQYPPGTYASPFYSYTAAAGDFFFSRPAYFADQQLARFTPTYAYEFNEPHPPALIASPLDLRTYHGSEVPFVFQTPAAAVGQ